MNDDIMKELNIIRDDLKEKLNKYDDIYTLHYDLVNKKFCEPTELESWDKSLRYSPHEINEFKTVKEFIDYILEEEKRIGYNDLLEVRELISDEISKKYEIGYVDENLFHYIAGLDKAIHFIDQVKEEDEGKE